MIYVYEKITARTRPMSSDPSPTGTVKFRARNSPPPPQQIATKKKKLHFTIACNGHANTNKETDSSRLCHVTRQNKNHLPVMRVCEHQVTTFCRVYEWLYRQDDNSSTVQIVVICQLRLVSIRLSLNQT